jgi:uncharacterized protein (DUF433 family)
MLTVETERGTFTPSEAALVSGVALRTVHREIDEGPLKPKRIKDAGKRTLREEDLLYLAVAKGLDTRLIQLTSEGKEKLHEAIVSYSRSRRPRKELPLFGGRLSLDLKLVLKEVRSRLELLQRAKTMVVEDPDIRGGEPCIRGTRIGVYEIASMLEQGASEEEILEGYPSLKRGQLELTRIFAQAYPRKGRPPRHPWHQAPWRETSRSATPG